MNSMKSITRMNASCPPWLIPLIKDRTKQFLVDNLSMQRNVALEDIIFDESQRESDDLKDIFNWRLHCWLSIEEVQDWYYWSRKYWKCLPTSEEVRKYAENNSNNDLECAQEIYAFHHFCLVDFYID